MPRFESRSVGLVVAGLGGFLLLPGNITGPPIGTTGAPRMGNFLAEPTCAQALCHTGNSLNNQGQITVLGVPSVYAPSTVYPLTVRLDSAAQPSLTPRWGFELTAIRLSNGRGSGSFLAPGLRIVSNPGNGRRYVTHGLDDVQDGVPGPVEWTFAWVSPDSLEGAVGFYFAGNAANGNLTSLGDFIYTGTDTTVGDLVPVQRATWGGLKSRFLDEQDP
jgi:hypothetical protein